MSDFATFIILLLILFAFFRFREYYQTELRFKYYDIQRKFEKNPLFKNVFIFREPGQYKTDGVISAEFKNYHVSVSIKEGKTLEISVKAYTLGDNQASVTIIWEPVRLAYNSITHIAEHLVRQTSDILLAESNTKYDNDTLSVSYKGEIPVQKSREYKKDLDDWFKTTHNYYD